MLYMVIVPIIPNYLRFIGAFEKHEVFKDPIFHKEQIRYYANATGNYSVLMINETRKINVNGILIEYEGEDTGIGYLFASKAAIQILIGPFSGHVIDRVGYDWPMMFGLT